MRAVAPGLRALCLVAALFAAPAQGEIYRFVDADGREHFTTDLSQVPEPQRGLARDEARARPAINRTAAPARLSPVSPGANAPTNAASGRPGRDPDATLGADRRARRETVARTIAQLESRLAKLEDLGAATRPPNNRDGKISRHRLQRYRARHTEWKALSRALSRARGRLDRLP